MSARRNCTECRLESDAKLPEIIRTLFEPIISKSGRAQARQAEHFVNLPPTAKFLFREVIVAACVLTGQHTIHNGDYYRSLATDGPPSDIGMR